MTASSLSWDNNKDIFQFREEESGFFISPQSSKILSLDCELFV